MADKIRVTCSECGKKLACPSSAAGKKVRCPQCNASILIRAGNIQKTPGAARSKPEDDPYQPTVPSKTSGMPRRVKKGRNASKKRGKSKSIDVHWSKKPIVGFGIMGASVASNAVQLAIMGAPNMKTAEGQGQAFGQGLVTVGGLIFGLVIVVRGFLANRTNK